MALKWFMEGCRAGYDVGCSDDLYDDGVWTIRKEWCVTENHKRVPNTTVYAVYENDDGDFPLFDTLKEAKTFVME